MNKIKPHKIIALTETTRVRVFRVAGRVPRVAVWRAFRLVLAFGALLACACSSPAGGAALGDVSYQHATLCVQPELADAASLASERWHAASARVVLNVVSVDGIDDAPRPGCGANVIARAMPDGKATAEGETVEGLVIVLPTVLDAPDRAATVVTHEIGHLLLGAAWPEHAGDTEHSTNASDLMSDTGNTTGMPSNDDVARLPKQ